MLPEPVLGEPACILACMFLLASADFVEGVFRLEADDCGVPPPLTVLLALLPMLLPPPVFPVLEPRGLLPKGHVPALLFPSWLPPLLPVLLTAAALPPAAFPCIHFLHRRHRPCFGGTESAQRAGKFIQGVNVIDGCGGGAWREGWMALWAVRVASGSTIVVYHIVVLLEL